jgi:hypothetical protein
MWKRSMVLVGTLVLGSSLSAGIVTQAAAKARAEQRTSWVITRGVSAGRQLLITELESRRMSSTGMTLSPLARLPRDKRLLSNAITYLYQGRALAVRQTGVSRGSMLELCTNSACSLIGELRHHLAKAPGRRTVLPMLDTAVKLTARAEGFHPRAETVSRLEAATRAARDAFLQLDAG